MFNHSIVNDDVLCELQRQAFLAAEISRQDRQATKELRIYIRKQLRAIVAIGNYVDQHQAPEALLEWRAEFGKALDAYAELLAPLSNESGAYQDSLDPLPLPDLMALLVSLRRADYGILVHLLPRDLVVPLYNELGSH